MNDKPMNPNELADQIRKSLGLPENSKIEVVMLQFDRTHRIKVQPPSEGTDFAKLGELPVAQLRALGFQQWDEGRDLWLFPAEWYDHIPTGTTIYDFDGEPGVFKHGETDNDQRFGALAYGIMRKEAA